MKTQRSSDYSPEARDWAEQVRAQAKEQVSRFEVQGHARTLAWRARYRAVAAGRRHEAAVWLEALAVLGDRGGQQALELDATLELDMDVAEVTA